LQRTSFLAPRPRRGRWRLGLVLTLVGAALAGPAPPAGAATPPTHVGTGTPGSCTATELKKTLAAAPSGGTILFRCGPSPHTITGPELVLDKDVTIDGGGLIALSGGNANRVVRVNAGVTAELRDLTIRDGRVSAAFDATGGGILNRGTLEIENSTVTANTASGVDVEGGGIFNVGTLTLKHSTVTHNTAAASGAFGADAEGGGIFNEGGALTIENSTLANNTASASGTPFADAGGGGIHVDKGTLTLKHSTVTHNTATVTASFGSAAARGGGIHTENCTLTIENTTVANNTPDG
jgi:hypothetical protein